MNEPRLTPILWVGLVATALTALIGRSWGLSMALGIAAGGLWNVANLWCLAKALHAWLQETPTTRRTVLWVLVKFPLLYGAAIALLLKPTISPIGFAIGFSVILATCVIMILLSSFRLTPVLHGR